MPTLLFKYIIIGNTGESDVRIHGLFVRSFTTQFESCTRLHIALFSSEMSPHHGLLFEIKGQTDQPMPQILSRALSSALMCEAVSSLLAHMYMCVFTSVTVEIGAG